MQQRRAANVPDELKRMDCPSSGGRGREATAERGGETSIIER
jgi:hypothetical protein